MFRAITLLKEGGALSESLHKFSNALSDLRVLGFDLPDMPRIVLVGKIGCGKSSILEALIGIDLIPKTYILGYRYGYSFRRPLEVTLKCTNESGLPWVEFEDGKKLIEFM